MNSCIVGFGGKVQEILSNLTESVQHYQLDWRSSERESEIEIKKRLR